MRSPSAMIDLHNDGEDDDMAVSNFSELVAHKGHDVTVVTYGMVTYGDYSTWNVAIECAACDMVLLEYDNDEG